MSLAEIKKRIAKLEANIAGDFITYTMKDGSRVTVTSKQLGEDSLYSSWVFHNAAPQLPASDGSRLHALSQAALGTLEKEFEPWLSCMARCGAGWKADDNGGLDELPPGLTPGEIV